MTQGYDTTGVDKDAIRAWAEALKGGLGLVRFSELSEDAFNQMLSGAAYKGRDLYLVIAQNATMDGLAHLEESFPDDVEILQAVANRREELAQRNGIRAVESRSLGDNVVAFPTAREVAQQIRVRASHAEGLGAQAIAREEANGSISTNTKKAKTFSLAAAFKRLVRLFAEPASGFDYSPEQEEGSAEGLVVQRAANRPSDS